jgi:glycosyltransferase involved in cell wall biosynthesis
VDVLCTNLATRTTVLQPHTFTQEIEGVHVTYLATQKILRLGRDSFGIYYMPELRSVLKRIVAQYQVVHVNGFYDFISLLASRQAHRAGVPYVIQPRGTIPFRPGCNAYVKTVFNHVVGRRMIRQAAGIIVSSDYEAQNLCAMGADRSQIELAYNGVDSEDYDPRVSGTSFRSRHHITERFIVLYFGRVHRMKGIDHMLRAAIHLARRGLDIAAVIVGPDEGAGAALVQMAREEGFEHLYLVPEVRGKSAKQEMFGAADVLVYAGFPECFGNAAFEGILSGVPTVVAAGTGCGEVVQRFNAGSLVPYGDVDAMERVLYAIWAAPDKTRERTLAARADIVRALDWAEIAKRMCRFYEGVCCGTPACLPAFAS